MEINRSRLSTCLAKAIAYQQVDKTEDAEAWARELIKELKLVNILKKVYSTESTEEWARKLANKLLK
jgi:hypothetical protein